MLKKVLAYAGAGLVGFGGLFLVANRPMSYLFGYVRAGASTTVKSIEKEIPDAIHDEKAQAELTAARQQLVDRQVQLNLSQNQLKGLRNEIAALTDSIGGRKQILGTAYPVLRKALDGGQEQITFVSTEFTLSDFQHEIDDLLAMQDRDEHALRIKQQGYEQDGSGGERPLGGEDLGGGVAQGQLHEDECRAPDHAEHHGQQRGGETGPHPGVGHPALQSQWENGTTNGRGDIHRTIDIPSTEEFFEPRIRRIQTNS